MLHNGTLLCKVFQFLVTFSFFQESANRKEYIDYLEKEFGITGEDWKNVDQFPENKIIPSHR